jgi:DNA-directed RNA polymerase subunit alpha
MEKLLLPSKVEIQEGSNPNTASLVVTPCYHGYGTTLGNALRRVLLSSLPGAAVESFKIKGAQHEFSAVPGIKGDVVELSLNLKQLIVRVYSDDPVVLTLSKNGIGEVTAKNIAKNAQVDIINPDLVLATITDKNTTLEMEILVGRGRGYKPVEEKDKHSQNLGTIMIDSIYTPVKDVGYVVEYTRVGDITNYERLTVNVETNGTISPADALKQSVQILIDHFNIIMDAANQSPTVVESEAIEKEVEEEIPVETLGSTEEAAEEKTKKKSKKK